MPKIFKKNATTIERLAVKAGVSAGFFGALIHIIIWLVPAIVSPALTGTNLTGAVLPNFLHITATVIIASAIAEIQQIRHRTTAKETVLMVAGAIMALAAGTIHFYLAIIGMTGTQTAEWTTYLGNGMAITGALTSACAIARWNPED